MISQKNFDQKVDIKGIYKVQLINFACLQSLQKHMFTGIVKLAQIDDYITPSQNCIQPKIMKISEEQTKATVTLNDCLACSGCITSAQSVLVDQMSLQKFKSVLKQQKEVYLILSPQSLISLSFYYSMQPSQLFAKLSEFFMTNFPSIKKLYFEGQGIKICHELIFRQFLARSQKKQTVICSQCPGWVCYAEKTLSQEITELMSQVKSPQQIMARLIKQKYGNHSKVISIMPCFDKKLQAIRFNLDEGSKQVDITLATNQVQNLLKQFPEGYFKNLIVQERQPKDSDQNLALKESENLSSCLEFLEDQTSNGYVSMILKRLNAQNVVQKIMKNSDFIEISAQFNGTQIKMAKCYGFRNIQKVVSLIKRKKCEYAYIQIMACPGGCYGGGGQIRYENKKQKDLISQFKQLQKPQLNNYSDQPISGSELSLINSFDFSVHYKPIQKSFTSTVMNW